jgi:hypothetical protein
MINRDSLTYFTDRIASHHVFLPMPEKIVDVMSGASTALRTLCCGTISSIGGEGNRGGNWGIGSGG